MDCQHVKGSETLLKSERQCFCDIFWSLSKKISPINAFLEVFEILRLFVSVVTPDNKYMVAVKASVERSQFKCNYLTIKKHLLNFFLYSGVYIKFWILSKKSWASQLIFSWNYRLEKAELLKSQKNPISEHLLTVNML